MCSCNLVSDVGQVDLRFEAYFGEYFLEYFSRYFSWNFCLYFLPMPGNSSISVVKSGFFGAQDDRADVTRDYR